MYQQFKHPSILASAVALLLSSFAAGQAFAADCQAKLVEAGSHSVSVANNSCSETGKISVGSVLELAPGSRMWLKFDPSASGETVQLICQNKAGEAVKVSLTGASEPWITTEGVKDCSKWKNNKFSCESESGQKNSFFCAVAKAKPEPTDAVPKITTSVKMRSVFSIPVPVSEEDVIRNIKPEIELCKALYNITDKVEMSWTVLSQGQIQNLNIQSGNHDFISCIEEVVKEANANQVLNIKHAF